MSGALAVGPCGIACTSTSSIRLSPKKWCVKPGDRSLAGPVSDDDREATYHHHLVRTINARYGDALKVWETRIVDYVGRRDEHTTALAKRLDELQRRGINAELMLDLASALKPLPTDHPTAALAYRVKDLVTPRKRKPRPATPSRARPFATAAGHSDYSAGVAIFAWNVSF